MTTVAENIATRNCQGFDAKTGHMQRVSGTLERNVEIQGFSGIYANHANIYLRKWEHRNTLRLNKKIDVGHEEIMVRNANGINSYCMTPQRYGCIHFFLFSFLKF